MARSLACLAASVLCTCAPAAPALGGPISRNVARHSRAQPAAKHWARCALRAGSHANARAQRLSRHHAGCERKRRPTPSSPAAAAPARKHAASHHAAAPRSAVCADIELTPTDEDLERVRAATMCLINREREAAGEAPLTTSPQMQLAAQAHTEDMASNDYFEHVSPRGDTLVTRLQACGYIFNPQWGYDVAENIGEGVLAHATPQAVVADWMASPEHRANILNATFRDSAVGVSAHPPAILAEGVPGAIYTQDFGVIIKG